MAGDAPAAATTFPAAELDRRFYAFAVDRLIAWGAYAVAGLLAWRFLFEEGRTWTGVGVLVGVVVVVSLLFSLLLGLRGTSPGRALLGLRVVHESTGAPIGVPAAMLRSLVLGLAAVPTFGFGLATLAWTAVMDRSGQRRGAHDRLTRAVVVDVRPVPVIVEEVAAAPRHVVNLTAMRLVPAPPAVTTPSAPPRAPRPAAPPPSAVPAPVLPPPAAPRADPPPAPPLPPPPAPPTTTTPATTTTPVPTPAAAPAALTPTTPTTPPPPPRAKRRKLGPPLVDEPAPTTPESAGTIGQGTPAPAHAAAPRSHTTAERTVIRASGTGPARWRVGFDSGESFVVEGLVLVGRRPEPRQGEPVRHLVPLRSGDMSLSKTHAQVQVAPDGVLVVMDRGSTNGSVLVRQGVSRPLAAGKATTLLEGDLVRFGDRHMTVAREG